MNNLILSSALALSTIAAPIAANAGTPCQYETGYAQPVYQQPVYQQPVFAPGAYARPLNVRRFDRDREVVVRNQGWRVNTYGRGEWHGGQSFHGGRGGWRR